MRVRHGAPACAGIAAFAALALAAGSGRATTPVELHVYSSMPLAGASAADAADVVRGEQMALHRAPAAGVRLVSLNDATRRAGGWDPEATARDMRAAASDQAAIAYIGEFNSGASAISIPVLNQAGILQISPDNTYPGLTNRLGTPGPGEPQKYYPTGRRTFGRLVPTDAVEARALAAEIEARHVHRLLLLDDGQLYGRELAVVLRRELAHGSVRTTGPVHGGPAAAARLMRRTRADGLFFGGIAADRPDRVWRAAHRARPRAKLFASDALTDPAFLRRIRRGGAARATFLASNVLPQSAFPPAAAPFFAAFRARYGHAPRPYAIYGYEAMRLVLDDLAAARAANPNVDLNLDQLRSALVAQFFATHERASVLGTYSITPTGDTTLGRYGVYRVTTAGALRFDHVVDVKSP